MKELSGIQFYLQQLATINACNLGLAKLNVISIHPVRRVHVVKSISEIIWVKHSVMISPYLI